MAAGSTAGGSCEFSESCRSRSVAMTLCNSSQNLSATARASSRDFPRSFVAFWTSFHRLLSRSSLRLMSIIQQIINIIISTRTSFYYVSYKFLQAWIALSVKWLLSPITSCSMEFSVHLFTYFPWSDVLPMFYLTRKLFLVKTKGKKTQKITHPQLIPHTSLPLIKEKTYFLPAVQFLSYSASSPFANTAKHMLLVFTLNGKCSHITYWGCMLINRQKREKFWKFNGTWSNVNFRQFKDTLKENKEEIKRETEKLYTERQFESLYSEINDLKRRISESVSQAHNPSVLDNKINFGNQSSNKTNNHQYSSGTGSEEESESKN